MHIFTNSTKSCHQISTRTRKSSPQLSKLRFLQQSILVSDSINLLGLYVLRLLLKALITRYSAYSIGFFQFKSLDNLIIIFKYIFFLEKLIFEVKNNGPN